MSKGDSHQDAVTRSGKPVLTAGYDLRGNRIGRLLRHWLRMKTRIMGNYDRGPGLLCIVKLALLHRLGGPVFRLRLWLNSRYRLKARLRGIRNRLTRN